MADGIPKVLSKVKDSNQGYNVKLRYRKSRHNNSFDLYLDYYDKGKRKTQSLDLKIIGTRDSSVIDKNNLRTAYALRDEQNRRIIEGDTGVFLGERDEKDFMEFFKSYSDRKPDSNYRISHGHFKEFLTHKCKMDSIGVTDLDMPLCEAYKDYLLSKFATENTASHYFVTFKATLNYAVKLGYITNNPARYITIKYDKRPIERLTLDELKILKNSECKNADVKMGFLFACFTGLRLGDLNRLKYSDIKNNRLAIVMGKTKKPIQIPLKSYAKHIISQQAKHRKGDRVFIIPSGGSRSKLLREWFKNAGITKPLTFHCSRHTFGCLLIENGVDIFNVMKLMGHSDTKTTLQYVEKVGTTAEQAIAKLPEF